MCILEKSDYGVPQSPIFTEVVEYCAAVERDIVTESLQAIVDACLHDCSSAVDEIPRTVEVLCCGEDGTSEFSEVGVDYEEAFYLLLERVPEFRTLINTQGWQDPRIIREKRRVSW